MNVFSEGRSHSQLRGLRPQTSVAGALCTVILLLGSPSYGEPNRVGCDTHLVGSKAQALVFERTGVNIVRVEAEKILSSRLSGFITNLRNEHDAASLPYLLKFVEQGGRACVIVGRDSADDVLNGRLRELLAISVSREDVRPYTPGLAIAGKTASALWEDLQMGSGSARAGILSYLTPAGDEWNRFHIKSAKSGEERCLSAHRTHGKGEILFLVAFSSPGSWGMESRHTLTSEENLELFDNAEATVRLFSWLAGKTSYGQQQKPSMSVAPGTCRKCGRRTDSNWRFCPYCGAKVNGE